LRATINVNTVLQHFAGKPSIRQLETKSWILPRSVYLGSLTLVRDADTAGYVVYCYEQS
jgi:hypothetical protein